MNTLNHTFGQLCSFLPSFDTVTSEIYSLTSDYDRDDSDLTSQITAYAPMLILGTGLLVAASIYANKCSRKKYSQNLINELDAWANQGLPRENRVEAKQRILTAIQSKSNSLDLSDLGLTSLPNHFNELTHLRTLNLCNNQLTTLPALQLPMLQNLYLSNNQLTTLPALELPSLQILALSNNQLTTLPALQLPLLKNLDLTNNQLTTLPALQLPLLQILALSNNQLTTLPALELPSLQTLYLLNNQLTTLPALQLPLLKNLDLTNNQLTTLPALQLPMLQNLYLSNNQLTTLPALQLPMLQNLYLSNNQLTTLPALELPSLQILALSNNQLTTLPALQLPLLKNLDLTNNQLTTLPALQLPLLQILALSNNQLTTLPALELPSLQTLYLLNNQLTTLPALQLPLLKNLDLTNNQLTTLPALQLPMLQNLYLSNNQLTTLPALELPSLQTLYLANNQLTTLPVWQLPSLQNLHLENNQLTTLPVWQLPSLQNLYLANNQLTTLPALQLPSLHSLYLSNNQLTTLPALQLPSLQILDLSSNQLTTLPALDLPLLQSLNLSSNQLTTLPVWQLPMLQNLYLMNNQLTTLPALQPPSLRRLDAFSNPLIEIPAWVNQPGLVFTAPIAFRLAVAQERFIPALIPACNFWLSEYAKMKDDATEFISKENLRSLEGSSQGDQKNLQTYLIQLQRIQDFRQDRGKEINLELKLRTVEKIVFMLKGMIENEDFKAKVFSIIIDALDTCGDRNSLYLNYIEIQWMLFFKLQQLSIQEKMKFILGVHRQGLVEQKGRAASKGNAGLEREIISVLLKLQVDLTDSLQLPNSTKGMLYPRCGLPSEITEQIKQEVLKETNSESLIKIFATSELWRKAAEEILNMPTDESKANVEEPEEGEWLNVLINDKESLELVRSVLIKYKEKTCAYKQDIQLNEKLLNRVEALEKLQNIYEEDPEKSILTALETGFEALKSDALVNILKAQEKKKSVLEALREEWPKLLSEVQAELSINAVTRDLIQRHFAAKEESSEAAASP